MIYLDHAATTYVKKEVLEEMLPYFDVKYGNPSSLYSIGKANKLAIDKARVQVAKVINASEKEIFFTSCGSESNNWALKGIAFANKDKGNHIITSSIEHPAILNACKYLESQGFKVTYLAVDKDGLINLEELENSITDKTVLISIMFANNEIGTIEPIQEISYIAKKHNIYLHTDAVQAVGNVEIDVDKIGIDMLSMSAHKFYGPKGMGVLYVKEGTVIDNFMHGGGQESGKRAGTENVAGIVGIGKAIELAYSDFYEKNSKLIKLRERLINGVTERITCVKLNGHRNRRLPGNVNFSFDGVDGESILLMLNMKGIYVSTGSACSSSSSKPSHVLTAIGLNDEMCKGSIRLTIGDENTEEDIEYTIDALEKVVERLREIKK
ncbi:MAG: cysteine desulfurase NifS [Clostridiales bacterium]|nr:cysteine desulfurase NifS [Clostridiales bacterium]